MKTLPQKANSLSLPDSPDISFGPALGANRARSHSLRVDDILLRRSSSLRQGLIKRDTSSVEEISFCFEPAPANLRSSIKIPLNGSIGLEVTPPEEGLDSTESLDLQGTIV
jgi:potassium channel subfamily T protein 1